MNPTTSLNTSLAAGDPKAALAALQAEVRANPRVIEAYLGTKA